MSCDDARILMMKHVDGVITAGEAATLDDHLASCEACRAELADYEEQKAVTDLIRERMQLDAALDGYWGGVYNRLEQRVGWVLILLGAAILCGFGLVQLVLSPDVPLWIRLGVGCLGAGSLVLLISVIRWRIVTGKKDRYTEVIR